MIILTQKQLNKENLLNQGVLLLMQQGYHGTGLKEILDAVNIPKGSFYNYFGSKENFAVEVIQHYINPYIEQLDNHLQNPYIDAHTALRRYFNGAIAELEKTNFKGGCLLGNLMGELGDSNEPCRIALQATLNRYRNLLATGLARAQEEGSVRIDRTATELADLLLNTWQGALLRMKIEKSAAPLRQCCDNLLNAFFKV
ncbi:TetR/AcrR family transcriptional regulator [Crenothrix polyspora]|uniref:Transcriptional regulator, TetR family n=1 Tax=Crenothrix polyspora TaxID=360316 RepID=A0A1R4HBF9_9GAMM|nr:TetR/AcrR family transcriptional regulator [Crenothrix polyspora]SJM93575.1 Transcriptional regulator, TetR family [Crenothrix polyspora]